MSEEGTTYECPSCHAQVPFFIASNKRTPVVKCPNCGTLIKKPEVRGCEVKVVPRNIYDKAGKVPLEDLLREIEEYEAKSQGVMEESIKPPEREPEGKSIRDELFERPKDPCQVLAEILEAYGLSKTFTDWMIRRCERVGYLHPLELYHYMRTMRSGVKTEQEAAFIAEEYAQALQAEMQKAQRLNMNYPIPNLTVPINKLNVEPTIANRLASMIPITPQQTTSYPSPTYYQRAPPQNPSAPQVYQVGSPISPRDMIELFKVAQESSVNQTKALVDNLRTELNTQLTTMSNTLSQALQQLADAIRSITSSRQADPELIKALVEAKASAAKAEAQAEYHKNLIEIITKQYESDRKALIEAVKERDKEIEELRKTITELLSKLQRPVGEYKTDEAKLIAEALNNVASVGHRVVDALQSRKPLETLLQVLPSLISTQKVKTTGKTEEDIVKELEKEGLVEE